MVDPPAAEEARVGQGGKCCADRVRDEVGRHERRPHGESQGRPHVDEGVGDAGELQELDRRRARECRTPDDARRELRPRDRDEPIDERGVGDAARPVSERAWQPEARREAHHRENRQRGGEPTAPARGTAPSLHARAQRAAARSNAASASAPNRQNRTSSIWPVSSARCSRTVVIATAAARSSGYP